jgi:hypothetical protein
MARRATAGFSSGANASKAGGFGAPTAISGDGFTIRVSEQISGRLDVAAVKQHLGEGWRRFEVATVSTVVRVKALKPFAAAA